MPFQRVLSFREAKRKKMQPPPIFTCIMCSATKTNGLDYLHCRGPNCTSRICLCRACNLEKKERWFCSSACKLTVPSAAKKTGTRKRSRTASASAAADAAAEAEQKASLFDQAKASFETQRDLQSQLENWSHVVSINTSTLSALQPEVQALAEKEAAERLTATEQGQLIRTWRADLRNMLKDAYANMESTEPKTFSKLAEMKEEYDKQAAAHAMLINQHASTNYLLQSKEKEMGETQGAVEKAKRLMVEKQKQLEEEKKRFEEIFRRPEAGVK